MSGIRNASRFTEPFVMVALLVNGLLFCLGALSDHSSTVIVIYMLMAALNFLGSWKVGSRWNRNRKAADMEKTRETSAE